MPKVTFYTSVNNNKKNKKAKHGRSLGFISASNGPRRLILGRKYICEITMTTEGLHEEHVI